MTVQPFESNISDDSDDMEVEIPIDNVYRRKYQLLLERCEVLQQDNERIVNRVRQIKKILKRRSKDVKLLMERLETHGDSFRTATLSENIKEETLTKVSSRSNIVRNEKPVANKGNDKTNNGKYNIKKRRKPKAERAEKDPNAPKKPCNAFFQFCQEQRPLIITETTEGQQEPTKQEVTKQLASKWRSLSNEDKKVYVAMFERSKEKYAEEMTAYNIKKEQT